MAQAANQELVDRFEEFYRQYYADEVGELARKYPREQKSLTLDWRDVYRFDPDLADDFIRHPDEIREAAKEALRLYDLPVDVKLGKAHVRVKGLSEQTEIRQVRAEHLNTLVSVQGIVRKATDVRPKIREAVFVCQRCGAETVVPQSEGGFQEPYQCESCERQGPFKLNAERSDFIDAQKLRIQESPEGLDGGETPQAVDIHIEDDITGRVSPGDHITATGILRLDQSESGKESPIFDIYMEGSQIVVEDEQFEEMNITEEDEERIHEISNDPDIYEKMVGSIAPAIYGHDQAKLAMALQLFSGVTKHLPDGSRIRGDLHMLLIGDPGTGKSQLLSYVKNIAPRSVYTSGKGTSSAGLTAAAVRDDFGDGNQWTLEAGALVLADMGIAAVDELDKMDCITGDSRVRLGDRTTRIRDFAIEAAADGEVEALPNGRKIRDIDATAWTMTDDGRLETRPVTAIHEYDAPAELTRVTLTSGERLTGTADHPFFVMEDGERVEKPAAELTPGEWVFVPRSVSSVATDGGVLTVESGSDSTGYDSSGVSPSFAAVLGYLAGDGNLYYDRDAGVYGIRFTNKEPELLEDFEQAAAKAFSVDPIRPPSEQRDDGVQVVRIPGKRYADRVIDAGMNRETYDGKTLPESVTASSRTAKAAFVRALADSEGHVDSRTVSLFSASYELLLGTKQLLLEFGISSQIQVRNQTDKRDIYVLCITAARSLERFDRHIGFTLERKQAALTSVLDTVTGDRTIIDVIPDVGPLLQEARTALRLHQSECGLPGATYCNFENGDANISIRAARTVLERFEDRRATAQTDLESLSQPTWEDLAELKSRYHVSQAELADGVPDSQSQISALWGEDSELKARLVERFTEILASISATELTHLRTLVHGDVKWRRVDAVEPVPSKATDDKIALLKVDLAELLDCPAEECITVANSIVQAEVSIDSWEDVQQAIERFGITHSELATDVGVNQSTVTRWVNGTTSTDRLPDVTDAVERRVDETVAQIQDILEEIRDRRRPKVYDLTVEDTHNFIANGMVVHNSDDRSAMHEALEQQQISISKAGINATLKSRCSLLGAANPKYGRFDQYEPIGEQIDLEPALISRFDLIFTVTDKPNEEEDSRLAKHILQTNYAGELNTQRDMVKSSKVSEQEISDQTEEVKPDIESDILRKYIAYSRRNCYPTMSPEAKQAIEDFYVDLRSKGADEDAPVPVTARQLEAIVRLAEASARVRLSDTVEQEDADRVITIVRDCLSDIGIDPETGEFDADVIETGRSKTQRDRVKDILSIVESLEDEFQEGAPIEEVLDTAEEHGTERSKAEHQIENLKQKGELYEPSQGHLRTT